MAPAMLLVSNHPQQCEATSMNDSTSVLFGLEDEFVVTSVERLDQEDLRVVIEHRDRETACPACGAFTGRVKDRPVVRVRPGGERPGGAAAVAQAGACDVSNRPAREARSPSSRRRSRPGHG